MTSTSAVVRRGKATSSLAAITWSRTFSFNPHTSRIIIIREGAVQYACRGQILVASHLIKGRYNNSRCQGARLHRPPRSYRNGSIAIGSFNKGSSAKVRVLLVEVR